jgi:hypothetical protein
LLKSCMHVLYCITWLWRMRGILFEFAMTTTMRVNMTNPALHPHWLDLDTGLLLVEPPKLYGPHTHVIILKTSDSCT